MRWSKIKERESSSVPECLNRINNVNQFNRLHLAAFHIKFSINVIDTTARLSFSFWSFIGWREGEIKAQVPSDPFTQMRCVSDEDEFYEWREA